MFARLLISTKALAVVAATASTAAAFAALPQHDPGDGEGLDAVQMQLRAGLLASNELAGFVATACPVAQTDAGRWARGEAADTRMLRADGFVMGIREPLRNANGSDATSVAVRFRSASGADAYLARVRRAEHAVGFAEGGDAFVVAGAVPQSELERAARQIRHRVHHDPPSARIAVNHK